VVGTGVGEIHLGHLSAVACKLSACYLESSERQPEIVRSGVREVEGGYEAADGLAEAPSVSQDCTNGPVHAYTRRDFHPNVQPLI